MATTEAKIAARDARGARAPRMPTTKTKAHPIAAAARAAELIDAGGRLLGWEPWDGERAFADQPTMAETLDTMGDLLGDLARGPQSEVMDPSTVVTLCRVLADVQDLRRQLRDDLLAERSRALVNVQSGLSRLRGIGSAAAMIEKAPAELCRCCGFDRSILFRVVDSRMVAVSVYYDGDPEGAQALLEVGANQPASLDHMLLETEMIRRRIPMLVLDAQSDPRVHQPVAIASDSRSYVAAPIMPEGRVIGFLHADRYYQGRDVDGFDRDTLWAFAEGFGYAFERTVLVERLRAQRDQIRGMLGSTEQLMDELCEAEIEVGRLESTETGAAGRAAAMLGGGPSRLDQLLTRREIEVMSLLANGETNAGIARRLVITEGTVKSHVKHILRKLRAANRAEAVSRYLRIRALDQAS